MRVGIVGVTGYTGSELFRLLLAHGGVNLAYVTSRSYQGMPLAHVHPQYLGITNLLCSKFSLEEAVEKTDLVFSALPHGESMETVPILSKAGLKVIDLSADFRLQEEGNYEQWYGREHTAPDYLGKAVYGLPELYRGKIKHASLVANPGCYPTSVILALAPLAQMNLVQWDTLVVDSKSGTSGAGRVPSQVLHYPECTENFRAYRVARHQHAPEMEQELGQLAGREVTFTFVPHLVPMVRGILSTSYVTLTEKWEEDEIRALYQHFYQEEKYIRVYPPELLPETKYVYGSNYCDLYLRLDPRTGRLIIISVLDNLVKGAAGQALQNMNIMLGLPEDKGLEAVPLRP